jgi:serine/threonine-protein kinase
VKVTDFGIARLDTVSGLTQGGMTVGTPGYMAPEQFRGEEADPRTDLYAAAVVLFELLTGLRPFAGRSASELMYQVLNEPPRRATALNPRLPLELDAVLERGLAKAPDDRFQDAAAFVAALEGLKLVEREVAADGSTLIRVAPVQAPTPPPANTPPGWDAALLAQIEQQLVVYVGPVARMLVRKATLQVSSPRELVQHLAAAIPGEQDRLMFQRRIRGVLGGTIGSTVGTAGSGAVASQMSGSLGSFDQAALERARQDLAVYLGPIAKVLVKQAAAKARTSQELYQQLAEHIPTAAERTAFLKRTPALIG